VFLSKDFMNSQNFQDAIGYARQRLEQELSPTLVYHGIAHTRDEVVPAVEALAGMEGISGKSLLLLLTAAWFHDLGYVENAVHHELIGARMVLEVLPSFGYSQADIEVVRWAILATALPQSPTNLLEQILTDADLDVLGKPNFMKRNDDLRRELGFFGKEFSDEQWYNQQLKFIEGHQYFTASAHALRDGQKSSNINELKKVLSELNAQEKASGLNFDHSRE
jgi:uncharacterized protein